MVDIDTIGAGGGSIAYVDAGRRLPRRAAVGRRRSRARLLRARRHAADLDRRAARARPPALRPRPARRRDEPRPRARRRRPMSTIAGELGMTVEEAALGALQIQKYGMTQAIELNSVRRGYDPREFTLVAAGGAGPLFACDIALELEIAARAGAAAPRASSPPPACSRPTSSTSSSAPSAMRSKSARQGAALRRASTSWRRRPSRSSTPTRVPEDRRLVRRLADCRYAGQGYEVRTEVPAGAGRRRLGRGAEGARFHAAHELEYGHRFDAPIEIINIRVVGIGRVDELQPAALEAGDGDPSARRRSSSARSSSRSTARPSATSRRSTSASACAPATASPARRSSSSTTRRR